MLAVGMAQTPEMGAGVETHIRRVRTALAPWEVDRTYFNFTERSVNRAGLFLTHTHRRLRQMKALYDPEELFQAMHSNSPAR
jgi:hypothetical protein